MASPNKPFLPSLRHKTNMIVSWYRFLESHNQLEISYNISDDLKYGEHFAIECSKSLNDCQTSLWSINTDKGLSVRITLDFGASQTWMLCSWLGSRELCPIGEWAFWWDSIMILESWNGAPEAKNQLFIWISSVVNAIVAAIMVTPLYIVK